MAWKKNKSPKSPKKRKYTRRAAAPDPAPDAAMKNSNLPFLLDVQELIGKHGLGAETGNRILLWLLRELG